MRSGTIIAWIIGKYQELSLPKIILSITNIKNVPVPKRELYLPKNILLPQSIIILMDTALKKINPVLMLAIINHYRQVLMQLKIVLTINP